MTEHKQTMGAAEPSPWVFLGFDLRQIISFWLEGWVEALRWPMFVWIKPKTTLLVHHKEGELSQYREGAWFPARLDESANFHAVLLSSHSVLYRLLKLPRLSEAELKQLLIFEVSGMTPFGKERTLWGYRRRNIQSTSQEVELLLTSQAEADKAFSSLPTNLSPIDCELWGITPDKTPIILMGFGEDRRARYLRRQVWLRVALLLMIPVWLVLFFASPVIQARQTLQEAEQAFQVLQTKASTLEQTRNMVQMHSQSIDDVMAYIKTQPQPLAVLNLLSEKVPDTAYLQRFNINAQRVAISGQADNAASLMQVLGSVPSISNVRAPSAITRMAGSSKELFALEFNVDLGAMK